MKPSDVLRSGVSFPVVLGLADGVLTALTLTAGRLTTSGETMRLGMAARIAASALASGAFVFFVARYAQLRGELVHAERQLNLLSHGHLASTRLGRSILREALWTAVLSSVSGFFGSLIPLLTAVGFPMVRWGGILTSLTSLGIMGVALAHAVHGNHLRWCVGMVLGGAASTALGIELHIV